MIMKYKYVKKCDCCDQRFSKISLPPMNVEHEEDLMKVLIQHLVDNGFKGKFSLRIVDQIIIGFYYEYASAKEGLRGEQLCIDLYDIACDFYEALITEDMVWAYEEAA